MAQQVEIRLHDGTKVITTRNNATYVHWGVEAIIDNEEETVKMSIPWGNIRMIKEKIR